MHGALLCTKNCTKAYCRPGGCVTAALNFLAHWAEGCKLVLWSFPGFIQTWRGSGKFIKSICVSVLLWGVLSSVFSGFPPHFRPYYYFYCVKNKYKNNMI